MSLQVKVHKQYQGFTLDLDISMQLEGITILFGPSGAGKTSLLRCIAGLDRIQGASVNMGKLVWQDSETFVPPHKRKLGYVFQQANLFSHLSVQGNLEFARKRGSKQQADLQPMLDMLDIGHLLERGTDRLSGGEQQRVAIARALASGPDLLLMDEPLASLDEARKQEIMSYLQELNRELAVPVLYVSHARSEVARLADNLILLEQGKLVAKGRADEIFTRLDLPFACSPSAETLLDAEVVSIDQAYHLTYLSTNIGLLAITRTGLKKASRQRIRVAASDVSIVLSAPHQSSILNLLQAEVIEIAEQGPGERMLKLQAGTGILLSRVSQKSADLLQLQIGSQVFAQIKGVAVLG